LRWINDPAWQRCQRTMMHVGRIIGILGIAAVVVSSLAAAADFDARNRAFVAEAMSAEEIGLAQQRANDWAAAHP